MEEELLTKGENEKKKKTKKDSPKALCSARRFFLLEKEFSALFSLFSPLFHRRQCSPLSAAAAPVERWRRWPARREGERYVFQASSIKKRRSTTMGFPFFASVASL